MMDFLNKLGDQLSEQLGEEASARIPPVEHWHPEFSGDIDICIKTNGEWWHNGTRIERQSLVNLFASILKYEEGEYFLVTPLEKWRIKVEDAPLLITEYQSVRKDGVPCLLLKTTTGDVVMLSAAHPLTMQNGKPYVLIRHELLALVHRNVFYQWQEILDQMDGKHGIWSAGKFFPLE
jgi:hypothetical protein